MTGRPCFGPGELLLPDGSIPLERWACPASHRMSREGWQELEDRGESAPGVMKILVPDALLDRVETHQRLDRARAAMKETMDLLTRRVRGMVYLERTLPDGVVRRGLVGLVDLEQYEFVPGSSAPVRAVQALAARQVLPRIARWEDADLQSGHILLAAACSETDLFAPLEGIQTDSPVYQGELCYGGGRVKGWAVEDAARLEGLAAPFCPPRPGAPVLAAVSGGEDLAAARAYWMLQKEQLTEEEQKEHPARFCLAEVCSVESPGLRLAAAHRLVMGAQGLPLLAAFRRWCAGQGLRLEDGPTPDSTGPLCFVYGGWQKTVWPAGGRRPLAAGVLEAFLEEYLRWNPACSTDRLDTEDQLRELAADGNTGILLGETGKDLFPGLAGGGFLPRGLFAQGPAVEQRYELECRRIR